MPQNNVINLPPGSGGPTVVLPPLVLPPITTGPTPQPAMLVPPIMSSPLVSMPGMPTGAVPNYVSSSGPISGFVGGNISGVNIGGGINSAPCPVPQMPSSLSAEQEDDVKALTTKVAEAIGRAYTHRVNSHKTVDPDLTISIVMEIVSTLAGELGIIGGKSFAVIGKYVRRNEVFARTTFPGEFDTPEDAKDYFMRESKKWDKKDLIDIYAAVENPGRVKRWDLGNYSAF